MPLHSAPTGEPKHVADIRPFAAIKYVPSPKLSVSDVIAPPYDVLNEQQKAALQARHPNNIVSVDLPFMPPKSVGPDEVYARADVTLKAWLAAGILRRDARSATYPYQQTFDHAGKTYYRRGFVCLVRLSPFGQGQVIPHEKTYQGPIEDRLKLMRATGAQLSPIFGLFSDARTEVTRLLYQNVGKPELDGTLEGVRHQLWSVIDAELENHIIEMMGTKPIYIADGHHRYTTALAYQKEIEREHGGPLPPDHPANYCMFVLVGMQSDGLLVLPTHRLIGGLTGFDAARFKQLVAGAFDVSDTPLTPDKVADYAN